jgi:hypothetical protein
MEPLNSPLRTVPRSSHCVARFVVRYAVPHSQYLNSIQRQPQSDFVRGCGVGQCAIAGIYFLFKLSSLILYVNISPPQSMSLASHVMLGSHLRVSLNSQIFALSVFNISLMKRFPKSYSLRPP